MKRIVSTAVAAGLLAGAAIQVPAHHLTAAPAPTSCSISVTTASVGQTYQLSTTGIPQGSVLNLFISQGKSTVVDPLALYLAGDANTTGSPLGSLAGGQLAINESSQLSGVTTYEVTGPTKRNARATTVYGVCSVSIA